MEVKRQTAEMLAEKLRSEENCGEALRELRLISKHDGESRALISEAGAIPFLGESLYLSVVEWQDNATASLLNLSISSGDTLISTRGLLDAISHSSSSSEHTVQSCAATLHILLAADADDPHRSLIGSRRDIVHALIEIVRNPNSVLRSVKDRLKALFGIY